MRTLQRTRFYPMWLGVLLLLTFGVAAQAADFKLTDTQGRTHTLSGYKGKWVLVNYWATWCPPCLDEIPDLIALHNNKKNNLVVIGVALDYRNPKDVTDFADSMLVDYPIVLGNRDMIRPIGPVQGLPTTYLFNPEGKMVAQQVGAITRQMVETYIASKTSPAKTKQ